jgi:GDPmannose 4,6-dehydratase
MTNKKVLVTGVLGQDGANMCEYLLEKEGLKIFGMIRRSANSNFQNCTKFLDDPNFQIVYGDLTDPFSIDALVREIQPDYFINFAANSFVGCSWDMPSQVFNTNANGVMACLEAIRKCKPDCRFYSAGSSEEFGDVDYSPQDMAHPLKPRSPYGASKAAARHLVKVYKESYDLFAIHGVLFNHEGTKRGEEFVTRKISKGVAKLFWEIRSAGSWSDRHDQAKKHTPIELGNLDSKRDWSDSEDFVEGIWMMLNQDNPKDYLLASGECHSIREFVEKAFDVAGLKGDWQGEGVDEKYIRKSKHDYTLVRINPDFYRPAEVDLLMGDPSKTIEELGWKPKNSFDTLVKKMVEYDIDLRRRYKHGETIS